MCPVQLEGSTSWIQNLCVEEEISETVEEEREIIKWQLTNMHTN